MPLKVIQWATGTTGKNAIKAIINHPDLELVGVKVFDPEKVGKDAGVLAGISPIGITATDDEDALLALDADCILWMGAATMFAPGADMNQATQHICKLLKSGKNVISIVHTYYTHPSSAPAELVVPVEAACKEAGVSFLTTGIDPGFVSEVLTLTLTGISQRIESIKIQELLNYSRYENPQILFDVMSFGELPSRDKQNAFAQAMMGAFGSSICLVADSLGVELRGIDPYIEVRTADEDFEILAGTIRKGTISAIKFGFNGIVAGQPKICVEHITRLDHRQFPVGKTVKATLLISKESLQCASISVWERGENRGDLEDSVLSAAMCS
ncbi:MAG: dihydrodipicolinate reductase [Hahellaceae bacterium]|nr:dihydrodipicolinate reductase [Hahellaceae bacterium]